jgi:hypothetical protein
MPASVVPVLSAGQPECRTTRSGRFAPSERVAESGENSKRRWHVECCGNDAGSAQCERRESRACSADALGSLHPSMSSSSATRTDVAIAGPGQSWWQRCQAVCFSHGEPPSENIPARGRFHPAPHRSEARNQRTRLPLGCLARKCSWGMDGGPEPVATTARPSTIRFHVPLRRHPVRGASVSPWPASTT